MRLRKIKGAQDFLDAHPDIVIANPEKHKGQWSKVFGNDNPLHIEIGAGKGQFIFELALMNPDVNYIAIEKFDSVLIRALEKFINAEIPNVRLLLYDAGTISEIFDKEVDRIYLNFSDPWPKERHAKRRLTSPRLLAQYEQILLGEIIFKTDNLEFFKYSVSTLLEYDMIIDDITYDLHSLDVENIQTEFEQKFSALGFKINRVITRFKGAK
jgi:tRNA (guanine-N7-)-methyltransferase